MTAIVAVTDGKKVWMGGDSAGVCGLAIRVRKDPKVFRNGEFLIGFTSSFRMGQLLRYEFSPPKQTLDQDPFEFMVCSFVPAMKKVFREGGFMRTSESVESGGMFLVGWQGQIYSVQSDFQVGILDHTFHACGCGEDLAFGSLYSTEGQTPEQRITLALQAAERFSAGVRGPFTIVSS